MDMRNGGKQNKKDLSVAFATFITGNINPLARTKTIEVFNDVL